MLGNDVWKHDGWGGVYDGGKVGGTRGMWSEALLGSCWEAKEPAG